MNLTEIEWQGWFFEIKGDKQVFGKTKVEVSKEEIEEIFYIEEDYLSEKVCERLYERYLYAFGI